MTELRGLFPNVNADGREKAAVSNHCVVVLGPALGLPVTFGRSRLLPFTRPMFATSFAGDRLTVKGDPLCAMKMPPTRQPANAARLQAPALAKGKSYKMSATNRFLWSKLESPFSTARLF